MLTYMVLYYVCSGWCGQFVSFNAYPNNPLMMINYLQEVAIVASKHCQTLLTCLDVGRGGLICRGLRGVRGRGCGES